MQDQSASAPASDISCTLIEGGPWCVVDSFGQESPWQTKPKGQNGKFMNFAHFCEFWCFSLRKQARFTSNFCSRLPPGKALKLAFLWFGLPGCLLIWSGTKNQPRVFLHKVFQVRDVPTHIILGEHFCAPGTLYTETPERAFQEPSGNQTGFFEGPFWGLCVQGALNCPLISWDIPATPCLKQQKKATCIKHLSGISRRLGPRCPRNMIPEHPAKKLYL